ncbi:MAG TPA: hypothetical protein VK013_09540 [Myxococcaceae bacterium]|nr:hypothetical protein [Myxococcaceae bacterium]
MHLHLKSTVLLMALLGSLGCATTSSTQASGSDVAEEVAAAAGSRPDCCTDGMCAHHAQQGEAKSHCCGKDGTCKNPECVKAECCKNGMCGKAECCKKAACKDGQCPHKGEHAGM